MDGCSDLTAVLLLVWVCLARPCMLGCAVWKVRVLPDLTQQAL